jgi:type IV pilus assembly protein PilN
MIRINLLGVERKQTRRVATFDIGKRVTMACSLVLVVAVAGIGFWYWSLTRSAAQVEQDIAAAKDQQARLNSIIDEVEKFEARRLQLQQRVVLIEQLRKGQSLPVQLLDYVSKSVPEMLWLTTMEQKGLADVTLEGRATTMIAVSDFVANLGNNPFFKKPIDILETKASRDQAGLDLVEFTVKAQLASAPAPEAPAGRGARGAAAKK